MLETFPLPLSCGLLQAHAPLQSIVPQDVKLMDKRRGCHSEAPFWYQNSYFCIAKTLFFSSLNMLSLRPSFFKIIKTPTPTPGY